MEWIYYIAIGYWILNGISKALKKQKDAQIKAETMQNLNARVTARKVPDAESPYPTSFKQIGSFTKPTTEDIFNVFAERPVIERVFDQEEYDVEKVERVSNPFAEGRVETPTYQKEAAIPPSHFVSELSTGSHFRQGKGMTTALSDMSNMPKGMSDMKSVNFDVYHQKANVKPIIPKDAAALKKYFVISEIFGKPKALRKKV